MFTGGLENRSGLVRRIARQRSLWGIGPDALNRVRSPQVLFWLFQRAGVPHPAFWFKHRCDVPPGKWLVKPWVGTGGQGIRRWVGRRPSAALLKTHYFQEHIEGMPCAAIFVGDGQFARLLGVTHQLVGERWLHARPFQYCGSIGPLPMGSAQSEAFERLGIVLAKSCRLRGLFGVDCVLRGNIPWPVEVNPRYTASVEVVEHGTGVSAMALHRAVFETQTAVDQNRREVPATDLIGKAILFARASVVFPKDGPWVAALRSSTAVNEMPEWADIPRAGEHIASGWPVLTFFVRADSQAACLGKLRSVACHLDRWLFER
jgi:predicted ATP-grasp superfamily ATP-dependent carboligase